MDLSTAFQNMVNACKAIQLTWDQQDTLKRSVDMVSEVVKKELEHLAVLKQKEQASGEENTSGAV